MVVTSSFTLQNIIFSNQPTFSDCSTAYRGCSICDAHVRKFLGKRVRQDPTVFSPAVTCAAPVAWSFETVFLNVRWSVSSCQRWFSPPPPHGSSALMQLSCADITVETVALAKRPQTICRPFKILQIAHFPTLSHAESLDKIANALTRARQGRNQTGELSVLPNEVTSMQPTQNSIPQSPNVVHPQYHDH
jgi:hypothetical protein